MVSDVYIPVSQHSTAYGCLLPFNYSRFEKDLNVLHSYINQDISS